MTQLPRSLTTVTRFSKFLAGIIFFAFLFAAFLAGMKYQEMNALMMESKVIDLSLLKPTRTLDNTANWKTYRFLNYPVEFTYPNELKLTDASSDLKNKVELTDGKSTLTIDARHASGFEGPNWQITSNPLTVNGKDVYINDKKTIKRVITHVEQHTTLYSVALPYPTKREYTLVAYYRFDQDDEDKIIATIFDEIISTLKFTDQISPTKTSLPCLPEIDKNIPCQSPTF